MGIQDFFRKLPPATKPSDPAPPPLRPPSMLQPGDPQSGNPGVTKIEREHFLLHAPFQWKAVPSDNPLEFEFRNQTLAEQLIVTVLIARTPLAQAQVQQVASELAEKRLNALRTISNGHATHSPPRIQTGSGQAEVRCVGRDDPQKVKIAFIVRVAPAKVVTVALTRYFLEDVGAPFEAYSDTIFDFLQVMNPGGSVGT